MNAYELLSDVLVKVKEQAKEGITTLDLNDFARDLVLYGGGVPFNQGYLPDFAKTAYPYATCISVNHEIVHGIPSGYVLKRGDLINVDMSVQKDGKLADAALSFSIGQPSMQDLLLLQVAKKALYVGIRELKPGAMVQDVTKAIEKYVLGRGFTTVLTTTGHGIGKTMHEPPEIYNGMPRNLSLEVRKNLWYIFKEGDVVCIEPQITSVDREGKLSENGWTIVTRDFRRAAFFEHTVEIVKGGYNVLTSHVQKGA